MNSIRKKKMIYFIIHPVSEQTHQNIILKHFENNSYQAEYVKIGEIIYCSKTVKHVKTFKILKFVYFYCCFLFSKFKLH